MADIYAFGPDWELPPPVKKTIDTAIDTKVNTASYTRAAALTATDKVEDLPTGLYKIFSAAAALGMPTNESGSLWVHRLDNETGRMEWRPTKSTDVWSRRKHGPTWGDWESPKLREWGQGKLIATEPINLDVFAVGGVFEVPSHQSAKNLGLPGPGTFENLWTNSPTVWTQRFTVGGPLDASKTGVKSYQMFRTVRTASPLVWHPWQRVRTDPVGEVTGAALTLADTGVPMIPHSVGVDGALYGSDPGMKYAQRSLDGLMTPPEQGPNFVEIAGAGNGIVYTTRTSSGYLIVYKINATTHTMWHSPTWGGPYTKVLDLGPWSFTSLSKPRLVGGATWLMFGEYAATTPSKALRRWLSTDGGKTWKHIRSTTPQDTSVNSHCHTGLIRGDGRLYVSEGDGVNNWLGYSDDLGSSWVPVPTDTDVQLDRPYYSQPTCMIDFGGRIALVPDRGQYQPGVWLMEPDTHRQQIQWELKNGGPYADASKQYGRSVFAQAGATGREAYVMFPDGGSGNNTAYIAATPDGGNRWGVVAEVPGGTGTINTGVFGPDRNGFVFMRGVGIPTFGNNVIRAAGIDWDKVPNG